ncbi:MAG: hypothetical protein B6244_06310 [Candidatus Cloacimonetes bacterium 4572_55]|nr:MAG: hypothetical protein B6244_06310 [Candidatus Cloacimonetes bacterium 4572_55]
MWKNRNLRQKLMVSTLLIVTVLATILVMQNWKSSRINIFFWQVEVVLSIQLLFTLILGFGLGWLSHIYLIYREKRFIDKKQPESMNNKPNLPEWSDS